LCSKAVSDSAPLVRREVVCALAAELEVAWASVAAPRRLVGRRRAADQGWVSPLARELLDDRIAELRYVVRLASPAP